MKVFDRGLMLLALIALSAPVSGEEVKVAVAANFTAAMKEIASAFEAVSDHRLQVSYGSTGTLYAQIDNGAPFEVFLAADQARPERLEAEGRASGRFTYAVGRLVLWSADPTLVDGDGGVLETDVFRRLAIANPKTAPYGAAAVEVMQARGLYERLGPTLVRGNNIAQTYQFVATRNAELGFVALSQIALEGVGSSWLVPQALYSPIRQDAVLLEAGAGNPGAAALIAYLKDEPARAVIEKYGYGVE